MPSIVLGDRVTAESKVGRQSSAPRSLHSNGGRGKETETINTDKDELGF